MRRTIAVPKDKAAFEALSFDNAIENQLIEVVLKEQQFKYLWDYGFFSLINTIADVNIDAFEDEKIVDINSLNKVIADGILDTKFIDKELNEIVHQVKQLFLQAVNLKTGVFFFF